MDLSLAIMHVAVLAAALVQSATGIGFGLIACPVILIVVNAGSAIQIAILLSLLVALILAPPLYQHAPKPLLTRMALGTIAGLPLGIIAFQSVDVAALKLGAGACVVITAVSVVNRLIRTRQPGAHSGNTVYDILTGVVSGAMSVSLAMPGPPAAARMAVLALSKEQIRSTSLVLFTFSYAAAFAVQWALVGVTPDTLSLTLSLTPAALIGLYLGRKAVAWISERTFLWIIAAILTATAFTMLVPFAIEIVNHA